MLLVWGLLCAILALVSIWPPRRYGLPAAMAFFAGWLTIELPWHTAIGWSLITALLAWRSWPLGSLDLAGLALFALALAVLAGHVRGVALSHRSLGEALAGAGLAHEPQPAVGLRRLALIAPRVPPGVTRVRDLPYGPAGRRNFIDVWRPIDVGAGAARPALLYIHGGAWMVGDKELQGLVTLQELASAGWVCFSMNYRLSPRAAFPAQLDDVRAAMAWIRAHGAEHGADPSFLVLCGGSAGAHLAALAALTATGAERVQGCVSYYGLYDLAEREASAPAWGFRRRFLERMVFKRQYSEHPEVFEQASPIAHVSADAPPFFVLHGARDSMVPVEQARRFVARLREAGARVTYAELPGAQHAFEIFVSRRSIAAVRAVRRWCQALREQRSAASRQRTA